MAPGFLILQSKVWVTRLPRYMKPLVCYNTVCSINFLLVLAVTSVAWYHASILCFTRFRKFRTKITTINNEIFILFYFHNENVRVFFKRIIWLLQLLLLMNGLIRANKTKTIKKNGMNSSLMATFIFTNFMKLWSRGKQQSCILNN